LLNNTADGQKIELCMTKLVIKQSKCQLYINWVFAYKIVGGRP